MIRSKRTEDQITVYLHGEIDHCAAQLLREEIERLIRPKEIKRLMLDFSQVAFMDSSGVGMLIGRYKTMLAKGGQVHACALSAPVERLFRMAGLHRIISIDEQERRKEA